MLSHLFTIVEADKLHESLGRFCAWQSRRDAFDPKVRGKEGSGLEMPFLEFPGDGRRHRGSMQEVEGAHRIQGRDDGLAPKLPAVRATQLVDRAQRSDLLDVGDCPVLSPRCHAYPKEGVRKD